MISERLYFGFTQNDDVFPYLRCYNIISQKTSIDIGQMNMKRPWLKNIRAWFAGYNHD